MALYEVVVDADFEVRVVVNALTEDEARAEAEEIIREDWYAYCDEANIRASLDVVWLDDEDDEDEGDARHLIHPHLD